MYGASGSLIVVQFQTLLREEAVSRTVVVRLGESLT